MASDSRSTCSNLRQLSLYDDMLVPRHQHPRYGAPTPQRGGTKMMSVTGTEVDTPEGELRTKLLHALSDAVVESVRRPGSGNARKIAEHIAEAAALTADLAMMEENKNKEPTP